MRQIADWTKSMCLGLSLLCTMSSLQAEQVCAKPLKIHLDLDAPSAFLNDAGEVTGMDAELAATIMQAAGCQWRWHLVPMTGARILKSLEDGDFDIMIRASKNAERAQYAFFSQAYRQEVVGLFSRRLDAIPVNITLNQALTSGLQLIGPASGWYGVDFEQLRSQWRHKNLYTAYPDAIVATDLLFASPSRGDLVWVDADIFYHRLTEEQRQQVQLHPNSFHNSPALLMLSKATVNTATLAALNQAIRRLQQAGKLTQIERKYRPLPIIELLQTHPQISAPQ